MKFTIGTNLRLLASSIESIAEGCNTLFSITSFQNPATSLTKAMALTIGLATGVIEWVTCYNFQGAEVQRHLDGESVEDNHRFLVEFEEISRKRRIAYLSTRYGYMAFSLSVDYLANCLLYSATKAWIQDFQDGEDTPLSFISKGEAGAILVYFLLFDLPFILTGEMAQTLKEMRSQFHISYEQAPDRDMLDKIEQLMKPLAGNNFFRKTIRVGGSLGDTIEHLTPLIIIVPPSWILAVINSPTIIAWATGALSATVLLTTTLTVLAQTYLFEGKFSENNLKAIAFDNTESVEDTRWVPVPAAKIFHALLPFGAALHGVDTGFSLQIALRSWEAPEVAVYLTASTGALITYFFYLYSEVKESKESLKAITREEVPVGMMLAVMGRTRSPLANYPDKEVVAAIEEEEKYPINQVPAFLL
jgi:hypothetical protein